MERPIRQDTPDDVAPAGGTRHDNPGARESDVSGSRGTDDADPGTAGEYDEEGTTGDGAEGKSGVPGRSPVAGTLTGTDRDQTGPDEDMATES